MSAPQANVPLPARMRWTHSQVAVVCRAWAGSAACQELAGPALAAQLALLPQCCLSQCCLSQCCLSQCSLTRCSLSPRSSNCGALQYCSAAEPGFETRHPHIFQLPDEHPSPFGVGARLPVRGTPEPHAT